MPEDYGGSESQRRKAAFEKKISDIKRDDVRVRLFGMVIDRKDNLLVLDDGSGKINVVFEEPVNADVNKNVRVFGRVMPAQEGFEIQGEILQDMGNVDVELYKKVSGLEKELA